MDQVINAMAIMTGLGLALAAVLAVAYTFLRVEEDPRLETVGDMLPGNNCGACGEPGCSAFAEKLVGGSVSPAACTVAAEAVRVEIAQFLGVSVGEASTIVARLRCAGGEGNVREISRYEGMASCRAAVLVDGGSRECVYGCLGLADCERACTFDAIHMNAQGLPVVTPADCTACGDCVEVCPLDLFVLQDLGQKLFVQCASPLTGEAARSRCAVACDACGRCAADSLPGVIEMKNGLPVINWNGPNPPLSEATRRCPTNAIVWLTGAQFVEPDSVRVERRKHA